MAKPDLLFIAGCVLIPLGFGLVPGLLPRRIPLVARWGLWLVVLVLAASILGAVITLPSPFRVLASGTFWLSSLLSLYVLLADTGRAGGRRRLARP